MKRLESQKIHSVSDGIAFHYEIILWSMEDLEETIDVLDVFRSSSFGFVIEVREFWPSVTKDAPNYRQVSRIEVGSLGMAQNIYHYTIETLDNL